MDYLIHILILVGIYAVLARSLDLLAGYTGLLSMAQGAFFGLGAYTSALLAVRAGASFPVGLLAGMSLAALASLMVSLPSLRLHDDYFVMATFGYQLIVYSVFNNCVALTRGPLGIPGIPPPAIFGLTFRAPTACLLLVGLCAAIAYLVVCLLTRVAYGRVLRAIREDEVLAQSLGKNTLRFKASAFMVSAALAASAGSLYAHYVTYISPASFGIMESILVLSMLVIGGAGSFWGPLVGAAVLVTLPEALRFVGMPSAVAANVRQILYGAALVGFMLWRPQGLLGEYTFEKGGSRGKSVV